MAAAAREAGPGVRSKTWPDRPRPAGRRTRQV